MQSSPASEAQAAEERHDPAEADRFNDLEDRYKRALADLDNYRKRSARETERRVTEARDALTREWLEAVDSIERALQNGADPGLQAVLEQMETILARHGVSRTGERGERFDPERHEAIGVRETADVPDQAVLDVARSGYRTADDRTLRPAQVVVARTPAATD